MLALVIGIIGGAATTMQASINTEARKFFRSPFIVAGLNFTLAWIILAAFIVFSERRLFIPFGVIAVYPPWIWLGGVCAIIIVSMGIFCVPKLGAAGNAMIMNFGQVVTGLVIDHFALFGSEEARMTLTRLAGAVMVLAGLMLVTREKKDGSEAASKLPVLYVMLSFIGGIACAVQVAVNGTLKLVIGSAAKATLISMSVAVISTLTVLGMTALVKGRKGILDESSGAKTDFRPFMVSGGLFALTVVCGNAAVAPVLGTGLVTILNLIGMMAAGLAIDATGFLGIEKKPVTVRKVAGMLLMLAGTAVISFL